MAFMTRWPAALPRHRVDVDPPIVLIAGLRLLVADRGFLTEGEVPDPATVDTALDHGVANRHGAAIAQLLVVAGRPARIRVAIQHEVEAGVGLRPRDDGVDLPRLRLPDVRLVKVEQNT